MVMYYTAALEILTHLLFFLRTQTIAENLHFVTIIMLTFCLSTSAVNVVNYRVLLL